MKPRIPRSTFKSSARNFLRGSRKKTIFEIRFDSKIQIFKIFLKKISFRFDSTRRVFFYVNNIR